MSKAASLIALATSRRIRVPRVLAALLALSACSAVGDLTQAQTGWITYKSNWEAVTLSAELRLPDNASGKVPAMVIAHASGGPDARNDRWARFLLSHGIATMQIDYFGPRGIGPESPSQPTPVTDAYDALRILATHPRVDAGRIGIIGFSRGAEIVIGAANAPPSLTGGNTYAAYVALYPNCASWHVNEGTLAPVLVLIGSRDDVHHPPACTRMVEAARALGRDISLKIYEGASHGWDGDHHGAWHHPAINRSYTMIPDARVTEVSRADVMAFLRRTLRL